ncbi:MAG: UbiA family prenyltransferase [Candidatus Hodarchaeota archaeon]
MSNSEIKENVKDLLITENVMYLATAVDGTPSVSSTFYGYDGTDSFELYFFTFTPTVKGQHINFNKNIQVHISKKANGEEIKGIQITGRAEQVKDKDLIENKIKPLINRASNSVFDEYYSLPVAGWYRIIPTVIKYIDFYHNPQFEFIEFRTNQLSFIQNLREASISRAKLWVAATRAPFFTASIIPILVGAALAWNITGFLNFYYLLLTLIGGIFLHAGTNMLNDYFDHTSRNDENNKHGFIPFFGGSRIIQTGTMSSLKVGLSAIIFFILGSLIGLYLELVVGGQVITILVLFGLFLGIFYTADPLRLGYHSLGELVVGLGFGPAYTLVSFYIQAGSVEGFMIDLTFWIMGLYWSLPLALLIANLLLINEFQDYEVDMKTKKNTLVVRLGKKQALSLYKRLNAIAYLTIIIGAFVFFSNAILTFIALLTIPLSLKAIKNADENYDKIFELIPTNIITIGVHLTTGLLIILGLVLTPIVFNFFGI